MARRCDLTGTGSQYGHKVSHSNRKTNVRFLPNLQQVTLQSDVLGTGVSLRVTAATLRSVEHRGGLDSFLLNRADSRLTEKARRLKRQIRKKSEAKAA